METNTEEKIIVAVKLRVKPPKRRPASARLKSRLYYRRNKSKIRLQRRRYMRSNKSTIKHRKMFMRYKPSWMKKPRKVKPVKTLAPKKLKLTVPKSKISKPKVTNQAIKKFFKHS